VVRVRCPRCGYEWEYRGRRLWVTCPNCRYTFRVDRGARVGGGGIDMFMAEGDVIGVVKECVEEIGGRYAEGEAGLDIEMPEGGWEKLRECLVRRGVRLVSDGVSPQKG